MTLAEKFEDAQKRVKTLSKAPSNDDLLGLYAFYKQATVGANYKITVATKYELKQGGTTYKLEGGKALLEAGDSIILTHGSGKVESVCGSMSTTRGW